MRVAVLGGEVRRRLVRVQEQEHGDQDEAAAGADQGADGADGHAECDVRGRVSERHEHGMLA